METILANNSHLGSLKEIADCDHHIDLVWTPDDRLKLEGSMSGISRIVEDWQPSEFSLDGFTEDDEL
jgi:hypothetical protein